ncbi:uncharacterized protein FRV6_16385 [Fusarium oxysporum]|uniref:Uncharacterized protein n=1 Tax=Fusarium oxysporum TaxID=5507 RepID=A0A2H3TUI5_FUSOX|nr:uncharacterized protein FRV6_16385 [Fusarium oxysporum]
MSSFNKALQRHPRFEELPKENQKRIMKYLELQINLCIDIASIFSISDPSELREALQDTFSVMPNIFLSDQRILREIVDLAFVPDEMPSSPTPLDADELSRGLAEVQRSRSIIAWFWSWVPGLFTAKKPEATQQEPVKGTKRFQEDNDEEDLPRRIKVIRKCKSRRVVNKQNSGP